LTYNSVDRVSVLAFQKLLAARGITTFLDRDQLVPGLPWPAALEQAGEGQVYKAEDNRLHRFMVIGNDAEIIADLDSNSCTLGKRARLRPA
jgi:hypothetical protein